MKYEKPTREFLEDKAFAFALRIARAGRALALRNVESVFIRQMIRSGTSIGANLAEATVAYSKSELASKLSISLKECRETLYWIRLLQALESLSAPEAESLKQDGEEIAKILFTSIRSLRS